MRTVAIDTNAYVAFKRGDQSVVDVLAFASGIQVCVTVLGELLGGFAAGSRNRQNRAELSRFLDTPRVRIVPLVEATADCYANIFASLRRAGTPIPTNDLWIAASCLEHGSALLTLDSHFDLVGGLRCGRRTEDFLP